MNQKTLLLSAFALSLGLVSAADEPRTSKTQTDASAKATESGDRTESSSADNESVRVHIDPKTGKIVAPPTTAQATQPLMQDDPALNGSTKGLRVELLPDGSKRVDLQGRFMHYAMARVTEDGIVISSCSDTAEAAKPAKAEEK